MGIKMKFPDGTEIEGEVEEISQLIRELQEIIGDFGLSKDMK